ncbi:rod shape-determining protein RodA [Dysgonomonas sp. ZJ279]|uniref:rod shape-determining protein RodA n=1 Tax=Dysgonomonas sp. ZJ279 TaxID=2709796 RepID=UPI0013ECD0F2|nr:rod shape-determining protein RodA [Dysgonomonas sp. ZJ279]
MYQREEEKIKSSIDWFTIAIYIVMVLCGWVSIYGASYQYENATSMFDLSGRAGMQLVWIGTSLLLGFTLLKLDSNLYDILAYYIYIFFMALLLLTIFIAPDIKGSRSWIAITDTIRLQPAEFAKFAVALALAKYMSSYNFKLMTLKSLSTILGLVALPIILILLQQETGSALVYTVFILVLYREGLPGLVLLLGVSAIMFFVVGLKYSEEDLGLLTMGEVISAIFIVIISALLVLNYRKDMLVARNIILGGIVLFGIPYLISLTEIDLNWGIIAIVALSILIIYLLVLAKKYWSKVYLLVAVFAICSIGFVSSINYLFNDVMQPHQQMRIKVSLGMEEDLMGAGYNVNQSKIAIGSGGLTGKGFLNGTQTKLKYVPEQDTDFIFCTVGEEQGFIGSVTVLILFLALILRLFYLAERQKNTFGRVYGYCVACIFLFHLTINVGMVIGLTPVIGIPLPFFSYGGSSLWAFTILLFIFLRIDMARKRR